MHKTQEKYYKHLRKCVGMNILVWKFVSIVFEQMASAGLLGLQTQSLGEIVILAFEENWF